MAVPTLQSAGVDFSIEEILKRNEHQGAQYVLCDLISTSQEICGRT